LNSISNIAKSIPPILQTIEQQTGLSLPDWLIKKNDGNSENIEKIMKVLESKGVDPKEVLNLLEGLSNDEHRQADITNKQVGSSSDKMSF